METSDLCSEDDLASLLADDPGSFWEFLVHDYGRKLIGLIRKIGGAWLNDHDAAEIYGEVLKDVWKCVNHLDYDHDQPPLALVNDIARKRTISWIRRKSHRRKEQLAAIDRTDGLIDSLKGTDLAHDWLLAEEDEKRILVDQILNIINTLKNDRERWAATAFIAVADEIQPNSIYAPLKRAMSVLSGRDETTASAKSSWESAKLSIRRELRRRGCSALGGSDS
jgi:DNA-directed RNA polymerase specialized sigma24 family protein